MSNLVTPAWSARRHGVHALGSSANLTNVVVPTSGVVPLITLSPAAKAAKTTVLSGLTS